MDPSPLDDHFRKPRNAGVLEGADLQVRAENPVCGDILQLYLKRGADGRVTDCKFQVYGCPAAIASGSLLTELLRGCSSSDLSKLTQDAIAKALGGLGSDKLHAAVLARDAVQAALGQWNSAKPTP
jgi:NifU-like protein involved in Fe-S cluster formation